MSIWTVILIIAVIAAIILGVLYFVGRKMQAKQEDQRAQLDQWAQTVNMPWSLTRNDEDHGCWIS